MIPRKEDAVVHAADTTGSMNVCAANKLGFLLPNALRPVVSVLYHAKKLNPFPKSLFQNIPEGTTAATSH